MAFFPGILYNGHEIAVHEVSTFGDVRVINADEKLQQKLAALEVTYPAGVTNGICFLDYAPGPWYPHGAPNVRCCTQDQAVTILTREQ